MQMYNLLNLYVYELICSEAYINEWSRPRGSRVRPPHYERGPWYGENFLSGPPGRGARAKRIGLGANSELTWRRMCVCVCTYLVVLSCLWVLYWYVLLLYVCMFYVCMCMCMCDYTRLVLCVYMYLYVWLYKVCVWVIIQGICASRLCVSSLRRGHANVLYTFPSLTDDPRRESICMCMCVCVCACVLMCVCIYLYVCILCVHVYLCDAGAETRRYCLYCWRSIASLSIRSIRSFCLLTDMFHSA